MVDARTMSYDVGPKIGFLGGDITSDLVNTPRLRGYERAMREMRLEPHIAHGNSLYESAPTALATLLAREPALTAIFALSDEMTPTQDGGTGGRATPGNRAQHPRARPPHRRTRECSRRGRRPAGNAEALGFQ